ncbi:MAG: hypothetical protein SGPRY_009831, partial [Prymnesium sp.]
ARAADLILVIANGIVAEQGGHDELFARRGLYFDLLQRESGAEELVEEGPGPDREAVVEEEGAITDKCDKIPSRK